MKKNNMKIVFFLITTVGLMLYCSYINILFAQKHDYVWIAPYEYGIDFNQDRKIIKIDSFSNQAKFCASIADRAGNLAFYCWADFRNTGYIKNANHEIIQNGNDMMFYYDIFQNIIIIPDAEKDHIYHIFSVALVYDGKHRFFIFYHQVDMEANNAKGAVVVKNKRLINSDVCFFLAATRHINGKDWWILTKEKSLEGSFIKILLTSTSVDSISSQKIGNPMTWGFDSEQLYSFAGKMLFSEQGDRLALVNYTGDYHLFDFDRCSGSLSNFRDFGIEVNWRAIKNPNLRFNPDFSGVNAAFSPDGSFFYVSTGCKLIQYDLRFKNIEETKIIIYEVNGDECRKIERLSGTRAIFTNPVCAMQLGPDGKIYITGGGAKFLRVIENPNGKGQACNFRLNGLYLDGKVSGLCLPYYPNYRLGNGKPKSASSSRPICEQREAYGLLPETYFFGDEAPKEGFKYNWKLNRYSYEPAPHGSPPQFKISPSEIWAMVIDSSGPKLIYDPDLFKSRYFRFSAFYWIEFVRYQNSLEFSCTSSIDTFLLYYKTKDNSPIGMQSIIGEYTKDPQPQKSICLGDSVMLGGIWRVNPKYNIKHDRFAWYPTQGLVKPWNSVNTIAYPTKTTTYVLYNLNTQYRECNYADPIDSITVYVLDEDLEIDLAPEANMCRGDTMGLKVKYYPGVRYRWVPNLGLSSDSNSTVAAFPKETTVYTLTVSNSCTTITKTIRLVVKSTSTSLNIGKEATICSGDSLRINLSPQAGTKYWWFPTNGVSNPKIINPVLKPQQTTTYILNAQDECSFAQAAMNITVIPSKIDLPNAGKDTIVCPDCEVAILGDLPQPSIRYEWKPSAEVFFPAASLTAAQPKASTTFTLRAYNECTSVESSVKVTVLPANEPPCNEPTSRRNNGGIGKGFYYYPNPVVSELTVAFVRPTVGFIELQDLTTKALHREAINGDKVVIDVRKLGLSAGVYLLAVSSGGETSTVKVVVR